MKKLLFIGLITTIINIFYGCCGEFPRMGGGIDCTNYKANRQILVSFNLDSINNRFKINEFDSSYCVIYEADSTNSFITTIDTLVFLNASILEYSKLTNVYQYGIFVIDNNSKIGNYHLKKN